MKRGLNGGSFYERLFSSDNHWLCYFLCGGTRSIEMITFMIDCFYQHVYVQTLQHSRCWELQGPAWRHGPQWTVSFGERAVYRTFCPERSQSARPSTPCIVISFLLTCGVDRRVITGPPPSGPPRKLWRKPVQWHSRPWDIEKNPRPYTITERSIDREIVIDDVRWCYIIKWDICMEDSGSATLWASGRHW